MQKPVCELFRQAGFKGYELEPAKARFAEPGHPTPELWELVARGSAGVPSPQSGYRVLRVCPGCGLRDDTNIADPTELIDASTWDGSDFFQVTPPSGWIFVTDRVVTTLRISGLKGWKAYSLAEKKEDLDIAVPGGRSDVIGDSVSTN